MDKSSQAAIGAPVRKVVCIPEMLDEVTLNACAYIRLFLPLTKPSVSDSFDVRFIKFDDLQYFEASVVIVQRMAVNTLAQALSLVSYCQQNRARLVIDLDDDLLSLPSEHPEVQKYNDLKHVLVRLLTEADELWVSTASLAARYHNITQHVVLIPNELDCRVWDVLANNARKAEFPVRILYMGTSTHRPDFDRLVRPAFSELKSEFGGKIELDLIGVAESADDRDWGVINRPTHIGKSYPAFATWLQSLPNYDIGLAPLLDNHFNRSKSDLKWQEYSALGLATIAADISAYNESIEHGRTGMLVEPDPASFEAAMRQLIVDGELRQSLKRRAVELASKKMYSDRSTNLRLKRLQQLSQTQSYNVR